MTDLATGSTRATFTNAMGNNDYSATGYTNFDATTGGAFDADISGGLSVMRYDNNSALRLYNDSVNDIQIIETRILASILKVDEMQV